mgnify:CR=1 FL=1
MKSKILIAVKDESLSRVYVNFFEEKGFLVSIAHKDDEIFSVVKKTPMDIIVLDVTFARQSDFKILKKIKDDRLTKKTPVILISHHEDEKYRKEAIEYEVKDFLVGEESSPLIALRQTKISLGEQKSYRLSVVDANPKVMAEIAKDLGYKSLKCKKCSKDLEMVMIRDLSKGHNYFKISFICSVCGI